MSAPVLSNEERARIGTLHKQSSAFDAKKAGAALVARNIARHLEELFSERPKHWRPLVYCWRGGQRSGAMTEIFNRIGWRAAQLEGGYKAYRRAVIERLDVLPPGLAFRVVCGVTGSGKSRLLRALDAEGAQVLDLEELAQHRGSVLGNLPDAPQPSQKMFETRVLAKLAQFDAARPVFVEAESKKVGDLRVPEVLMETMRASPCLRVEMEVPLRVELLKDEYAHFLERPDLLGTQLDCLVTLHGRERIAAWKGLADSGAWDELVQRLLTEHYDPAYLRGMGRNYTGFGDASALTISAIDTAGMRSAAQRAMLLGATPP
jgi:tRNA 2-selenouridine synthase